MGPSPALPVIHRVRKRREMKRFDNRGALTLTKKKLIITLGAVLGAALITWGVLMVSIFGKGKDKNRDVTGKGASDGENIVKQESGIPEGYREVYLPTKIVYFKENGNEKNCLKYTYDELGRVVRKEVIWSLNEGQRIGISTYEYDESGRVIREEYKVERPDFSLLDVYKYEFDEKGNLLKKTNENYQDGVQCNKSVEEHLYDSNGLLTAEQTVDDKGIVTARTEYLYNEAGTRKEKHVFRLNGFLQPVSDVYYNDEGNIVLQCRYDELGQKIPEEEYTYSDEGFLLLHAVFENKAGLREETVYEYDASGRKVRERSITDGRTEELKLWPEAGKCLTYQPREAAGDGEAEDLYLSKEEWFDERNRADRVREYKEDGSLLTESFYKHEYNEYGLMTCVKRLDSAGNADFMEEYEYTELSMMADTYAVWTGKYADGKILFREERDFYLNPDGSVMWVKDMLYYLDIEGRGYYYTFDDNGNPSEKIQVEETTYTTERREYERFFIPAAK